MPYPSQFTNEQLIEAARTLFEQHGFESVTMAQVAGVLGIKASSLYKHVNDKNALLREVGRVMDAGSMLVLLYDEPRRELEVVVELVAGVPRPARTRYAAGVGLSSWVAEHRESIRVVAEDLHLDGFGIAFEIAEHVLQKLYELDINERCGLAYAVADVTDDFVGRAASLVARLETNHNVAGILGGREETEL